MRLPLLKEVQETDLNDPTYHNLAGQVKSGHQVRSGQNKSGQVRSERVRSGQVRSGQNKSCQIRSFQRTPKRNISLSQIHPVVRVPVQQRLPTGPSRPPTSPLSWPHLPQKWARTGSGPPEDGPGVVMPAGRREGGGDCLGAPHDLVPRRHASLRAHSSG